MSTNTDNGDNMDKEVVLNLLDHIGNDGHTIWEADADFFSGMPEEFMGSVTETLKSDGSPKGTIWRDGEAVDEMQGVYGLTLLWRLARLIGADMDKHDQLMGRGFRACALTEAIREKLGGADNG